ncbi:MAG: hypothetical protein ABEN55_09310 [Bradymonadaceae bacterium]
MKALLKEADVTSMKEKMRQRRYRRQNKAKLRRKRRIRREKQRAGAKMKKQRKTVGHTYQSIPSDPSSQLQSDGSPTSAGGAPPSAGMSHQFDPEAQPESMSTQRLMQAVTGHSGP